MKLRKDQQEWFDAHTKQDEIPETTIAWLRTFPKKVHSVLKKFPPSCVVIATEPLSIPGKDKLGVVINLTHDGKELKVAHCDPDDNGFAGMCEPKSLKVIGYWRGLNSEKVQEILSNCDN